MSWLRRLIGERSAKREPVSHSVLGELRFDADLEAWRTVVETQEGRIGFLIAGGDVPDPLLLQHACDLVAEAGPFLRRIRAFLEGEADSNSRWADEIRKLSLEEVCLFWPKRPDDGMLYFGPEEARVWRCDYVNRTPQGLGFDS